MDNDRIIGLLNDLIETCKDGEYGFETCAEHATSEIVRRLLRGRAQDCRTGAQELQRLVVEHGGEPEDGGSTRGAVQRGWVKLLGAVAGINDHRILEAAERGEDSAVTRYRNALQEEGLPPPVRAVIERQAIGVRRNHDQVKALRDCAALMH